MIRFLGIVLFLLCFFVISIPLFLIEYLIGKFNPRLKERSSFVIVTTALRMIGGIAGIKLTVRGQENVPIDEPVLYVSNHRSYFDIITLYPLTKNTTGFVAKKELGRYPFISQWMKLIHCQFLDRDNIKEGLKTIKSCVELIKNDISICIFPEGTRTSGDEMLEFKDGSFKIAEKSGCKIIPVAISNSENVFETHMPYVKSSPVVITFGEAVDPATLSKEEKKHIGQYFQTIIAEMIVENHQFF